MSTNILVSITNYEFSDNADALKKIFENKFKTIIIDSSSSIKPKGVDIVIENKYYTGLWNESVKFANENKYEWLFFIASDISFIFPDHKTILDIIEEVTKNHTIGIYSPCLDPSSRFSFKECIYKNSESIRDVKFIEGFIFLARTQILDKAYPVDYKQNKLGWSIDTTCCDIARINNYRTVVDDRICIHHPRSKHKINKTLAFEQGSTFNKITLRKNIKFR